MSNETPRQQFKLKNDKHRKDRGGTAKFFDFSCSSCGTWLLLYQKDGPGNFLRLYLNRIFAPPHLAELQDQAIQRPQDMENLTCSHCGNLIGTPMRHLDDRLAYRLQRGSFSREKSDGTYPRPEPNPPAPEQAEEE